MCDVMRIGDYPNSFCNILSLFKFVQYEFFHYRVQYCKCDKINEQ